jgi:hypothetical protein
VAARKAENGELDFPVKPFQPFIANYLTGHRLATAMTEEKTSISPRFQPKCDYSIQGHAFRERHCAGEDICAPQGLR